MGHPSAAQKIVRQAFKKSCNCFQLQPDAGGATPPAIGPRNKSWWYAAAAASGLRYYNYFIHKTELLYLADTVPNWCKVALTEDSLVNNLQPDQNYGNHTTQIVTSEGTPEGVSIQREFIKTPTIWPSQILYLFCFAEVTFQTEETPIGIYEIDPDAWAEMAITWNNKPALGALLDSKTPSEAWEGNWIPWDIGSANSVCLKYISELGQQPPDIVRFKSVNFRACEYSPANERPHLAEA